MWKWSYPHCSFGTGSSTASLDPSGTPRGPESREVTRVPRYSLRMGSRMLPASMYLFALSPGYSPASSQATLKGDENSLSPRMGATLVPVIFFNL